MLNKGAQKTASLFNPPLVLPLVILLLKNAVEEIKALQADLHRQSECIDLSDNDKILLYEKGMSLGFEEKETIDKCIQGNEVALGYHRKKIERAKNKLKIQNENRFAKVAPGKKIQFFGKNIEFGSCYFIENFTNDFFYVRLEKLKDSTIQKMKNITKKYIAEKDFGSKLTMAITENAIKWGEYNEKYVDLIGLEQDFCDKMKIAFKDIFMEFGNDLTILSDLLTEIDTDVAQTKLYGDLRKAFRGRWMIGGIGMKGIIAGAITGSVLNTATGLAYDAINGVSTAVANHNAKQAKEELVNAALVIVEDFFKMVKHNTPVVMLALMEENYPYSVWMERESEQEIYEQYYSIKNSGDNRDKQIYLAIELLKENPHKAKYYRLLYSEILQSDVKNQKNYTKQLMQIASFFEIGMIVKTALFDSLLHRYDSTDIRLCDEFATLEDLLGYKSVKWRNKVYATYLEKAILEKMKEYSPEEISISCKKLEEFKKRYGYSLDDIYRQMQKIIFNKYGIVLETNNTKELENNIRCLEKIKESCSWDLSPCISQQKKKLSEILKAENEKLCTTEILTGYDIVSKKFTMEKIIAPSVEKKEEFIAVTPQIEETCKKIFFELEEDEFKVIFKKLRELCEESGYKQTIAYTTAEQWYAADKEQRLVKGVEYETRAAAAAVRPEMDLIDSAYKALGKSQTLKYLSIMNQRFNSEQARKTVLEKEASLIKHIEYLEGKGKASSIGNMAIGMMGIGASIIIPFLKTLGALAVFLIFKWTIVRIIVIFYIGGLWMEFFQESKFSASSVISKTQEIHQDMAELAEFHRIFKVVDGHIVLQDKQN